MCRYKARGINSIAAAANEIECEQIITLQSARWASYVWRRGSVPLRWSQAVKPNGVGTAIAIEGDRTFSGSRRYFPTPLLVSVMLLSTSELEVLCECWMIVRSAAGI